LKNQKSVLNYLIKNGYDLVLESMMEFDCDLDQRDEHNITPLEESVRSSNYTAAAVLLDNGADPFVYSSNNHPLVEEIIISGNLKMMKVFIKHFPNILYYKERSTGMTIMHMAVKHKIQEFVELFMEFNVSLKEKDINGFTPYDYLEFYGMDKIKEILEKHATSSHTASP